MFEQAFKSIDDDLRNPRADATQRALVVIDVQVGFLRLAGDSILPAVLGLVRAAKAAGVLVASTKFVNDPGSQFVRLIPLYRLHGLARDRLAPGARRR